jgi:hypothetical protein
MRMPCKKHPETESIARCFGCQESFCENCLVEISGQRYCGSCKVIALEDVTPVLEPQGTTPCNEANDALIYAIISIFCFGIFWVPWPYQQQIPPKERLLQITALPYW